MVDSLDHIHYFQRSIVARDMTDPRDLDINTCYAAVKGTTKHVGTSFTEPAFVEEALSMLHMIAGSEEKWRERPFVSMSNCFVVPPMKFATDACRCLEAGVRGGMPVLLLAAGQAGATSPASLVGAVVQEVAEVLGGLVYVNCIKPGAPAIFGPWPFVSDLRTGAMSGGSGEQALLMAACAQMAHYYDLTGGVCAGMTDSKVADAQAGYEKGYNYALVANAGANMIYEAAGMHASLLGFCLESLVIDNDAIGATLRTLRGLEINDEALSVDVIRDACIDGPGHFLGSEQTLGLMQSAYVYPTVGDRSSPKEWEELGSTDVLQKAIAKTAEILTNHHPDHISLRPRPGHPQPFPPSACRRTLDLTGFELRAAVPADEAAVTQLLEVSYGQLMPAAYERARLDAFLPLIVKAQPELLASDTYYLVVTSEDEVIGAGGWTKERPGTGDIDAGTGHIRHVATHPKWTGRGVGRMIIDHCAAVARSAGIERFACCSSLNAVDFYAHLGFKEVRPVDIPMGGGLIMPSLLMERTL